MKVDITGRDQPAPNKGAQQDFCSDWSNAFVALEGGWGSGKTWAGARKLLTLHIHNAFDEDGRGTGVPSAAVAPTYANAREFMVPALMAAADDAGLAAHYRSGTSDMVFAKLPPIMVRTAEKPERITGWEVGAAWGDEPARWKQDNLDPLQDPLLQLQARVRHPKALFRQLIFTYTNEGDHTRIYDEFHSGQPGHALYRASTKSNPVVVAAGYYQQQLDLLTPELVTQYLEGKAISIRGGKVYPQFSDKNVRADITLVPGVPLQLSVDFNIAPGMHALLGQYSTSADLFTSVHEIHAPRMSVQDMVLALAKLLNEISADKYYPELQIFGDATGSSKWAGTGLSCYQILKQGLTGLKLPSKFLVPKSNPPIVDRVNAVNVALQDLNGDVHWYIHPRCERLKADLQKLKRDDQGQIDKKERNLSHSSDAEGYRIYRLRPARVLVPAPPGRFNV